MEPINLLLYLLLTLNLMLLVIGIIKPTVVVWWEDVQNRRRVFKIYGSTFLLLIMILILTWLINKYL